MKTKRHGLRQLRLGLVNNGGFTLIEMAIVLIIIGIILGAVIKGKDLIRGAEQKRLYSTFIKEWQVAYSTYYERTGWILGDSNDPANKVRDGKCSLVSEDILESQLKRIGIEVPHEGPNGNTTERHYTDINGELHTINIRFAYDTRNRYNYMRIREMPNDLGIALDRLIDGVSDGAAGSFVYIPDPAVASQTAWPSAELRPAAGSDARLKLSF